MAIDYEKSLCALDEWLAHHASSPVVLRESTEKLFLEVFGKPFRFGYSDNPLAVMAKFNILLMREIVKDANKC